MNTPEENKRKLREIRQREAANAGKKVGKGADPTKKQPKGNPNFKAGHSRHFAK